MKILSQDNETLLITALAAGNENAFVELFDHYAIRLLHFSKCYLSNEADAEEIVQEVFLKVWKDRHKLDLQKSFYSFLFTIAHNAILNTLRKEKYKQAYSYYLSLNKGKSVLLDEELNFKELEKAYYDAIEQLPSRQKEIYRLHKLENLSNEEVAKKLGITIKTVENQITASSSKIRQKLKNLGFAGLLFMELFF